MTDSWPSVAFGTRDAPEEQGRIGRVGTETLRKFKAKEGGKLSPQLEMFKGTLDLMVLRTLQAMGAMHGFGIARRIEQVSADAILLNQGTIYASLVRLQQRGLIQGEWGVSDNNRKAKFYSITKRGSKRLAKAAENWEAMSAVMARFFAEGTVK